MENSRNALSLCGTDSQRRIRLEVRVESPCYPLAMHGTISSPPAAREAETTWSRVRDTAIPDIRPSDSFNVRIGSCRKTCSRPALPILPVAFHDQRRSDSAVYLPVRLLPPTRSRDSVYEKLINHRPHLACDSGREVIDVFGDDHLSRYRSHRCSWRAAGRLSEDRPGYRDRPIRARRRLASTSRGTAMSMMKIGR